jgi:hypothetical protein
LGLENCSVLGGQGLAKASGNTQITGNFNDFPAGIWYINLWGHTSYSNYPTKDCLGILLCFSGTNGGGQYFVMQIFISDSGTEYSRLRTGSSWGTWKSLV